MRTTMLVFAVLRWSFLATAYPSLAQPSQEVDTAIRTEFERRYRAWKDEQNQLGLLGHSSEEPRIECRSYGRITALGVQVVPVLIEELDKSTVTLDGNQRLLTYALGQITRRKFEAPAPENAVAWWRSRANAPIEFDKTYARWKQARANGISSLQTTEKVYDDTRKMFVSRVTKTELGKAYDGMRDFGIEAIPFVIEKLKAGDHDLLPLIAELTNQEGTVSVRTLGFRVNYTLDWWESDKDKWLLPPVSAAKLRDTKP